MESYLRRAIKHLWSAAMSDERPKEIFELIEHTYFTSEADANIARSALVFHSFESVNLILIRNSELFRDATNLNSAFSTAQIAKFLYDCYLMRVGCVAET
jgi:hypothetical protein